MQDINKNHQLAMRNIEKNSRAEEEKNKPVIGGDCLFQFANGTKWQRKQWSV